MPAPTSVLYRRDLLGRLVAAGTAADPKAFGAWSYRGDGALATETLRAGQGTSATAVERTFGYDGLGRPVSIEEPAMRLDVSYRKDGGTAAPYADGGVTAETVTYHAAGFPAGAVPPGSSVTYGYDAFGRLTEARSAQRSMLDVDAAYDGNGNLLSLTQAGESRQFEYGSPAASNKLQKVTRAGTGQNFAHDAAGAVTSAGDIALTRDPATGQMRKGTKASETIEVRRDARGRIVLSIQGNAKRLTLRDGDGAPLLERTGGALASVLLHGATGWIALWRQDQLYGVSKDLRNSTRILYRDGKAEAGLSYCAYGAPDAGATTAGPLAAAISWRYTGQDWLAPLALYDYGARLYSPALGRFLSPDPEDETPSPYMYVAGDPVNAVDPDGAVKVYWNDGWYVFVKNKKLWFTIESRTGTDFSENAVKRKLMILGAGDEKDPAWPSVFKKKTDGLPIDFEEVFSRMRQALRAKSKAPDFAKMYQEGDIVPNGMLSKEWEKQIKIRAPRRALTTARKGSVTAPVVSTHSLPEKAAKPLASRALSPTSKRVQDFAEQHVNAKPKVIHQMKRGNVLHEGWNVPPFGDKRFTDPNKGWGWSRNFDQIAWIYMDLQEMKDRKWFYWPDPTGEKIDTRPKKF